MEKLINKKKRKRIILSNVENLMEISNKRTLIWIKEIIKIKMKKYLNILVERNI